MSWRWLVAFVLWGACVLAGFGVLLRYGVSAAAAIDAPQEWPATSRLVRNTIQPTLLMFVHPRCSCSRASLVELNKIMARARGRVSATIVFARPSDADAGWEQSELRELATSIPDATLIDDDDEIEAKRFAVQTSGTCLLYGADGRREFEGGITPMRGHEGNSFGQERLIALLDGRLADRSDSPIFGCDLHSPTN